MDEQTVRLEVNGQPHVLTDVPADRRLVDVLREDLGLTGTKESCAVGVCGVCTVSIDTEILSSCLVLARTLEGASVRTIEGLAGSDGLVGGESRAPGSSGDEAPLTRLQDAFVRHGGFQCGICTPGQLMAATALLAENPQPTESAIREWMAGNLCRCTGYQQIVELILAAAASNVSQPPPRPLPSATG